MEPRVFIPQISERFVPDNPDEQVEPGTKRAGRMKPLFDLRPAAVHGQLTPVLESNDNPMLIARMTPRIAAAMESFNPAIDFLLPVGDPAVIAICTGLIMRRTSKFKMLKWDRHMRVYATLEINV